MFGLAESAEVTGVSRPRVLVVGGVDVHQRIELMKRLSSSFEMSAAGSADLTGAFSDAGFAYYRYPLERGWNPIDDARSFVALRRLYRRIRPDVVHTFATKPCVWGRLAASAESIPVTVGTIPGLGSLYSERITGRRAVVRWVYERLQTAACRESDLTIVQNHRDRADLVEAGIASEANTVVVLGSGVRTDVLDPALTPSGTREQVRADLGIPEDGVMALMISRVIRSKGVLDFAAAAERLRDTASGVRFVLAGPDDRDSVDRLTETELTELNEHVGVLGMRSDVTALLAAADIFVLPTFYREGVPRVLLEAASMALPLVATRTPGCEDVVRPGDTGLLVAVRDGDSLARAIETFAGDAGMRAEYGANARRMATAEFDVRVVADRIEELYGGLLARKA